jgi:hypothetical protein
VADRYCRNCGHELRQDDRFCPGCGRAVHETAHVPTPEADVDVPPPPQPSGGTAPTTQEAADLPRAQQPLGTGGRILLGCITIFIVLVVVGALGASLGGGGGGGNAEEKASAEKETPAKQPKLAVSSPSKSTTVDTDDKTFTVKGKVTPANAEVSVNGLSAWTDDDGSFSQVVTLDSGKNEIEITAVNGSKRAEYVRTVTWKLSEAQIAAQEEAEEEAARKAAEEEAAREAAEAEAAKNAAVGETVRVGDAEWTVTNAVYATELKQRGFGQFGESKEGNFVIVDFTFTNLASDSVTLDTISLLLFDSQGREYSADTDTFGYIPAEKDIFLNQVNPGVTQEGRIIYSVAPDASGFTIHAGDLKFFGAEEAKIKLGF